MPRPSPTPWTPKRLPTPSRRQRSSSFPRPTRSHAHRCQPPDAPTRRWAKRPGKLDIWPFDIESDVRVTCDVGYLCANFGLPRPLCSRLRPDVRDRQTSDIRQKHRLMPRLLGRGHNNGVVGGAWAAIMCNRTKRSIILCWHWRRSIAISVRVEQRSRGTVGGVVRRAAASPRCIDSRLHIGQWCVSCGSSVS